MKQGARAGARRRPPPSNWRGGPATIATLVLGEGGFIEPIDYNIVDKSKVLAGFALPHGVANYTYSYVLAYDTRRFPEPPRNWVDFWDRKKFPGMRTMAKTPTGQL